MAEKRTTDGRIARRERNQTVVLDVVVELFESGHADPAVEEVAEQSGVSTRSIYRYFRHREGLIDAALRHLVDRVDSEMPLEAGDGTLENRIVRFVDHRLDVHQRIAPLARASRRASGPLGEPSADAENPADDQIIGDVAVHPGCGPMATACFEVEFAMLPPESRRSAEVATEMAFQFESLEFLLHSFGGDRPSTAIVLVGHLRQHLTGA